LSSNRYSSVPAVCGFLKDASSPLQPHKTGIQALLIPDANDDHFAAAHVHTVMIASFPGQMKGADGGCIHIPPVVAIVEVLIRIISGRQVLQLSV